MHEPPPTFPPLGSCIASFAESMASIHSNRDSFPGDRTSPRSLPGNDGWGGAYARLGVAVYLLYPEMKDRMPETVDFGGSLGSVTRKEGWSKALRVSVLI